MTNQNEKLTQQSKEKGYYAWNDLLMKTFLEILCEYQKQNGQMNGFSWITLTEQFELKTSTKCLKNTLKNKYNSLKSLWRLWIKLKHSDTGLGWDYERNCIEATDEWWTKKLQENSEYRVFRKNGLHPEVQVMMEMLFEGTVATGVHCVAPSMDPPPINPIDEPCLDDEEPIDWDGLNIADDLADDQEADHVNYPDEENQTSQCPLKSHGKTKKTYVNKRNVKKKSSGKSNYLAHMNIYSDANKRIIASCDAEEARSIAQEARSLAEETSKTTVPTQCSSLGVLSDMVMEGLLPRFSPLWCFSVTFLMSEDVANQFMWLPTNEERLHWLDFEYKKEILKGTLPKE